MTWNDVATVGGTRRVTWNDVAWPELGRSLNGGTRSHIGVRSALGRSMRCVKCENKRVSVGRGCTNLSSPPEPDITGLYRQPKNRLPSVQLSPVPVFFPVW